MTMPTVAEKPRRYTVKLNGETVGKATLANVNVDNIKIDSSYQRQVSPSWVNSHLPFDPQKAGTIILSGRAGGPYCIDGGHRLALARESGIPTVAAFIIEGLSKQIEARRFVDYQRERRNLTSWALFRAELVAGDEQTLAMVRVVTNAGFRITETSSGPTAITAVDSVRYIHRYGGDDLLARTLGFVSRLWIGEEKALSGPVLKGLALFLYSAGNQAEFRVDRLERVMQKFGPLKMVRLSQVVAEKRASISAGPSNFAEALLEQYNKLNANEPPLGPLTIGARKRPASYKRP